MKKILIFILLCAMSLGVLTSCAPPNTVTSGTQYLLTMIGGFESVDELTLNGAAWRAIKKVQSESFNLSNTDSKENIKYYPLADFAGNDTVSYADAMKAAALKQLQLAAAGGAKVIIVPSDDYVPAFNAAVNEKAFANVSFVIYSYPGSAVSGAGVAGKTYVVVLDNAQLGYLIGRTAYEFGYKNLGFIGVEGAASASLASGIAKGFDEAATSAEDKSASFNYTYTAPGAIGDVVKASYNNLVDAGCDAIVSFGDTESAVIAASKESKVPYISASGNTDSVFTYGYDYEVVTNATVTAVKESSLLSAAYAKTVNAADGLFVYGTEDKKDFANALIEELKAGKEIPSAIAEDAKFTSITVKKV